MKPYRLLALLLLVALLLCEPAVAQMEDVSLSDIVRVTLKPSSPGEWSQRRVPVVGAIVSVSDDSLAVRTEDGDHSFDLRTIERMEVRAGTRSAVFEGAMIGAGVGTFFGLILAGVGMSSNGDNCSSCMTDRERRELEARSSWFSGEPSSSSSSSSRSISTSTAILIGSAVTGIGLVIGTAFGAATRVDRWQKVPVGEARRLQAVISARSVGMRLTF